MSTSAERNSPAPDHVIPFRLPPWLGWSLAFVLLLATGYFAISNFNARNQVDALRDQLQAADIEAKNLNNLLTAERIISANQIKALKKADEEIVKLQNDKKVAALLGKQSKRLEGKSTLILVAEGHPITLVTATDSAGTVLYRGPLSPSVSIPYTSEVTISSAQLENLVVWDEYGVNGTSTISYSFQDATSPTLLTIPAPDLIRQKSMPSSSP